MLPTLFLQKLLGVAIVMTCLALPACSTRGRSRQSGVDANALAGPDTSRRPDRIVRSDSGVWELRIWYRAKGSRSEGQHGVLIVEGRDVAPPEIGEERDTGLGRMKYYGPPGDRGPWAPTGWNYADPARMMPSTWVDPPKPSGGGAARRE